MQNIKDMTPREVVPGFFGRFMHGDQSSLTYWEIRKGSSLPEHHHVHEQITFILSGELQMTIGGVTTVFSAGSTQVIPSNVPHSAVALTDCIVIDSFSPVREEYKFQ